MATRSVSHSAGPTSGDQDLARHRALPNSVIDPMGPPWAKELHFNGIDDPAHELGFAADQTPTMVDFRERVLDGIVLASNCLRIQDAAATRSGRSACKGTLRRLVGRPRFKERCRRQGDGPRVRLIVP